ncbi:hypothetical protein C6I20_05330 [Aeromicrobium sp. A1-2]|uniref:protein kinase domain-containing protein n=1 Tax=Aeromicrobium sp. A1-2 TaxID=2107713 RepID=UPI000E508E1F|nr:hypothetical protein [Aeromicrobium sp. A1-2]AXT84669.1 hypothetical protein C6I20_05330 [Aeromicrobium sp. A1-2]
MTEDSDEYAVSLIDPTEYLRGNRRIVVDTSALLENREGYAGGMPQMVVNCAEALESNPLVIPRAVLNELTNQTSDRRALRDPELAKRAKLAKDLVQDLVCDGLATTDFGGIKDFGADPEFSTIAKIATEMDWEVLFLSADITVKLEVRLLGQKENTTHLAGVATADGLVEVENPAFMFSKGMNKKRTLADKPGKADEYDRLSSTLKEWPDAFDLRPQSKQTTPAKKAQNRRRQPPANPFAPSAAIKPPDQAIQVESFPGEGDEASFQRPGSNGNLVLGERISRGKEGSVYEVDGEPHLVAKIFKKGKLTTHRKQKVELMVQHKVWLPGICFPESTVSYEGEFVGFTMRRAQGANVLNDTIFIPQELDRLYPDWTRRDLVDVCLSFLKRVKALHDLNILIGDINPNNVMLGKQKDAWIIDIDSVQVEGYPCPVGWDEFTAPEILGGVQGLRSIEHEYFAIAVLLFMIMMTGTFPYENSGSDDTTQNIKSGLFPYGFDGKSERDLQPPLRWLYVWSHLSRELKGNFWHSFHRDGDRYSNGHRKTVDEWIEAFEKFKTTLSDRSVDPESLKIFPIRRKAELGAELLDCPQCAGAKLIAQYSIGEGPAKEFRTPSACNKCLPNCQTCGEPREPETLEAGICWPCRRADVEEADRAKRAADRAQREADRVRRVAEQSAKDAERARRHSLDLTRLCERCGKPYITLGEIDWLNERGIAIRPVHKHSDPRCVSSPGSSRPATLPRSGTTSMPKKPADIGRPSASQTESLGQRITRWFRNP